MLEVSSTDGWEPSPKGTHLHQTSCITDAPAPEFPHHGCTCTTAPASRMHLHQSSCITDASAPQLPHHRCTCIRAPASRTHLHHSSRITDAPAPQLLHHGCICSPITAPTSMAQMMGWKDCKSQNTRKPLL